MKPRSAYLLPLAVCLLHSSCAVPAEDPGAPAIPASSVAFHLQIAGMEEEPPYAGSMCIIDEDPSAMLQFIVGNVEHAHTEELLEEFRHALEAAKVDVPAAEADGVLTFSNVPAGRYWFVTLTPVAVDGRRQLIFKPFVVPPGGSEQRTHLVRPEAYAIF